MTVNLSAEPGLFDFERRRIPDVAWTAKRVLALFEKHRAMPGVPYDASHFTDFFLSESARLADIVLPTTQFAEEDGTLTNLEGRVLRRRKALEPPGDARADLWIINQLARGLGLDWNYSHPSEVFEEMRRCMDSIAGITWDRLERESSVTYPCEKEGDPGQPVVFTTRFPTPTGRGKFVPADLISAAERPDEDYPMVLLTGRQLEHWHTGSMTRRATVLDNIEPEPVASVHPLDPDQPGVTPGWINGLGTRVAFTF